MHNGVCTVQHISSLLPFNLILVSVGRGEREFPFPTILGNTGLPFPLPKFGNEFFIPVKSTLYIKDK